MKKRLQIAIVSIMFAVMLVSPCWSAGKQYDQGVTDKTIKIGTSLPLTGVIATAGQTIKTGMEAAVKTINAGGGINGRKLELVVLDDAYSAQRSVANVKRLVEQNKVFALLCLSGTGLVPASYPLIEEKGIILWAPFQPEDPNIRNMFFLGTTYVDKAEILADYLVEKGFKRPAVIAWDNQVGILQDKGYEAGFGKAGIKIVANNKVSPSATDLSGVVLKSKEADPDVLLLGTSEPQSGQIMKEARKLGWNVQFAGTEAGMQEVTVSVAGKDAEGALAAYPQASRASADPMVKQQAENLEKYAEDKKLAKKYHAMEGYIRVFVFAKVLEMMGDDLTWENFIAKAETLDNFKTGPYPPITFKPGAHLGTRGAQIVMVKNGAYETVTDWLQPK